MPLDTSPSTELYALGKGVLTIGTWVGSTPPSANDYVDVGNCPRFDVEVTEETLPHYSSRSGVRKKDKEVTLETGYMVDFDLDEISRKNLRIYLRASLSGTRVLRANMELNKEYSLIFTTDKPYGSNETWTFHRAKIKPGGAFSLITEEWQAISFHGEGLADTANNPLSPFFDVELETTTTTTTTTSTTTTTA